MIPFPSIRHAVAIGIFAIGIAEHRDGLKGWPRCAVATLLTRAALKLSDQSFVQRIPFRLRGAHVVCNERFELRKRSHGDRGSREGGHSPVLRLIGWRVGGIVRGTIDEPQIPL